MSLSSALRAYMTHSIIHSKIGISLVLKPVLYTHEIYFSRDDLPYAPTIKSCDDVNLPPAENPKKSQRTSFMLLLWDNLSHRL